MSDAKKTDKTTDKEKSLLTGIRDSAHKIWLAGLGAYAQYEKLGQEGIRLFENLVKDGEEVQARTQTKVDEVKEKIKSKTTDRLESRIKQLKDKLSSGSRDELKELSHQIEELSQAVKSLTSDRGISSKSSTSSSTTSASSKTSTSSTAKKPAAV
ncbi:phasin family protein [Zooshikella sp. RANM57]|uniref:phasin family protein n=1 Tax=Zooshikella sp. RANM57 TaxID=3425863 RepID=UPI003D6DC3A0